MKIAEDLLAPRTVFVGRVRRQGHKIPDSGSWLYTGRVLPVLLEKVMKFVDWTDADSVIEFAREVGRTPVHRTVGRRQCKPTFDKPSVVRFPDFPGFCLSMRPLLDQKNKGAEIIWSPHGNIPITLPPTELLEEACVPAVQDVHVAVLAPGVDNNLCSGVDYALRNQAEDL